MTIEMETLFGSEGCNTSKIVFDNSFRKTEVTSGILRDEAPEVLAAHFKDHDKG